MGEHVPKSNDVTGVIVGAISAVFRPQKRRVFVKEVQEVVVRSVTGFKFSVLRGAKQWLEQFRKEIELAGIDQVSESRFPSSCGEVWGIIRDMAGPAGGNKIPVLIVGWIPIEMHGGQPDRAQCVRMEQGISDTTPPAAPAIPRTNAAADRWPIRWIAPGIDHSAHPFRCLRNSAAGITAT
jgi:hypothetical protein